jgi:hypothetical protein
MKMCEVCAVFGVGAHWSDAAAHISDTEIAGGILSLRGERRRRLDLINRLLSSGRMSVSDWDGESYCLEDSAGRTRVVADLSMLWNVAEEMSGRAFDPLASNFIPELQKWSASYRELN